MIPSHATYSKIQLQMTAKSLSPKRTIQGPAAIFKAVANDTMWAGMPDVYRQAFYTETYIEYQR